MTLETKSILSVTSYIICACHTTPFPGAIQERRVAAPSFLLRRRLAGEQAGRSEKEVWQLEWDSPWLAVLSRKLERRMPSRKGLLRVTAVIGKGCSSASVRGRDSAH